MKTEIHRSFGSRLLALIVAGSIMLVSMRTDAATDTNIYKIYLGSDDDGGATRDWYATFYHANYAMMFNGLSDPLPEQLPASLDANGHWGPVVNGWQLSVRFPQGEYLTNEPVVAMIMLRNVGSTDAWMFTRPYDGARKNFRYVLHHATNTLSWSWSDPPPPDPAPPGYQMPKYFVNVRVEPYSQKAFFVRADQVFELSQVGHYSFQVIWPDRSTTGPSPVYREANKSNVVSGVAAFRIVDKLSDAELEARKTHEQMHQAAKRAAAELQQQEFQELSRRAMTNNPSAK